MPTPREQMVISTSILIRERGAHATAISDVIAHSGAPRGSAYHYFPNGRTQLLSEAVDYSSDRIASRIVKQSQSLDVVDVLANSYGEQLVDSDFRAGCPIVAVAVEAGGLAEQGGESTLIERAGAAFDRVTGLVAEQLIADGVPTRRSAEMATLIVSSIEGAIVLSRACRDIKPLNQVHNQLRAMVKAELSTRARSVTKRRNRPD